MLRRELPQSSGAGQTRHSHTSGEGRQPRTQLETICRRSVLHCGERGEWRAMQETMQSGGSDGRAYKAARPVLADTGMLRLNWRQDSQPNRNSYPFGAPPARIYRTSRSVMQSGDANARAWMLEFEPAGKCWIEPLMSWTATDDPFAQIRLRFPSLSAAVSYAEREGLTYRVIEPPARRRISKTYREAIAGQALRSSRTVRLPALRPGSFARGSQSR